MRSYVKSAIKKLRVSQPLNFLMTSTVRGLFRATGLRSDAVIKHLHRAGTSRCELPNGRSLKLWSRGDDWVSTQIYWRGLRGYEPETAPLFFRLAEHSRVILDVGAYVGFFTLLAAHANPNGRVFAFEPMPRVYERLRRNVAINRVTNVECIRACVGEETGTAKFYTTSDLPTSSSLSLEFMKNTENLQQIIVDVVSLDEFVREREIGSVDLIKIDTESTEPQVLTGMLQTLRRDQPIIFCEVLKGRGSAEAVEGILRPLGYRFYLLTPKGPIVNDHVEGHPEWLNYLFVPSHSRAGKLFSDVTKAEPITL